MNSTILLPGCDWPVYSSFWHFHPRKDLSSFIRKKINLSDFLKKYFDHLIFILHIFYRSMMYVCAKPWITDFHFHSKYQLWTLSALLKPISRQAPVSGIIAKVNCFLLLWYITEASKPEQFENHWWRMEPVVSALRYCWPRFPAQINTGFQLC